jgi:hypothetical protein
MFATSLLSQSYLFPQLLNALLFLSPYPHLHPHHTTPHPDPIISLLASLPLSASPPPSPSSTPLARRGVGSCRCLHHPPHLWLPSFPLSPPPALVPTQTAVYHYSSSGAPAITPCRPTARNLHRADMLLSVLPL